jgi:hypothetical protein
VLSVANKVRVIAGRLDITDDKPIRMSRYERLLITGPAVSADVAATRNCAGPTNALFRWLLIGGDF